MTTPCLVYQHVNVYTQKYTAANRTILQFATYNISSYHWQMNSQVMFWFCLYIHVYTLYALWSKLS